MLLIRQYYCVYMTLLASNRSICIRCRICWRMICADNGLNMRRPFCLSCMMPNEMIGFISWLVISHGFSWIHYYITRRLCREITWSQSRDLTFRSTNACLRPCRTWAASILSTDSQMIPKWTEPILWQRRSFYLKNNLFSRKGATSKTTYGSSR
jgi:hypothetical protein